MFRSSSVDAEHWSKPVYILPVVLCNSTWLSIAMRMMSVLQPHLGVLPIPCPTCFPSLTHCSGKVEGLCKVGQFLELLSKEVHRSLYQSVLYARPFTLPPLFPVKYWLAEQKWNHSNAEKSWGCSLFLSQWITLLVTPWRKLGREKNPSVGKKPPIK